MLFTAAAAAAFDADSTASSGNHGNRLTYKVQREDFKLRPVDFQLEDVATFVVGGAVRQGLGNVQAEHAGRHVVGGHVVRDAKGRLLNHPRRLARSSGLGAQQADGVA